MHGMTETEETEEGQRQRRVGGRVWQSKRGTAFTLKARGNGTIGEIDSRGLRRNRQRRSASPEIDSKAFHRECVCEDDGGMWSPGGGGGGALGRGRVMRGGSEKGRNRGWQKAWQDCFGTAGAVWMVGRWCPRICSSHAGQEHLNSND